MRYFLRLLFLTCLSAPLIVGASAGYAQDAVTKGAAPKADVISTADVVPNAEACTHSTWGYLRSIDYEYGSVNICSFGVDVWFMPKNGTLRHATAAAGDAFRTGLKSAAFDHRKGWIATTCPVGYGATVPVSNATWDSVANSRYECKKL